MSDKSEAEYTQGATNRAKGITKAKSHSHLSESDWNSSSSNRRGWDDMNTFITMATIFSKK